MVITGANTGLGYEVALDLAKRGGRIVMACRDLKKAEKAANQIRLETDNQRIDIEYLDLSDLESVRSFSKFFILKYDRLDILINNAGKNKMLSRKIICINIYALSKELCNVRIGKLNKAMKCNLV